MSDFISNLVVWATGIIHAVGYPGIAFLIALESVFPPMPSEVVLPLSGSLSASGVFNIWLALLAATIGSCAGASILYGLGRWGGEERIGPWLDRWGKWILLDRSDLAKARRWFARFGPITVMVCRVLPGLRSIVSIPAGLAHMPYGEFVLFTAIGSALWDGALIGFGFYLGANWEQVKGWLAPFGTIIYGIIFLLLALFVGTRLWSRFGPPPRRNNPDTDPNPLTDSDEEVPHTTN